MRTSLIIAEHCDDEAISYGGYIQRELENGNQVIVRVICVGGPCSNVSSDIRYEELLNSMSVLGVTDFDIFSKGTDGCLEDKIKLYELVSYFDKLIDQYKPHTVITGYPSRHQDHQFVHRAFNASMRLRDGYMPNRVAISEYPFILTEVELPIGGKWYIPMTEEQFKKKCEAFLCHESQQKPSPSPLGIEGLEILARTRGLEIGHKYAELFYLQKLVE